jgi:hypothetical protein
MNTLGDQMLGNTFGNWVMNTVGDWTDNIELA